MKVKDYFRDMVIGQKCIFECATFLTHDTYPSFDDVTYSTSTYIYPFSGKCRYMNYDVDYFNIFDNSIIFYVHDHDFV